MRMKQTLITLALLPALAATSATAADQDRDAPASEADTGGARIIIRSEAEKKRRDADNSNRQSGPDAGRGLERAQERRAEPADDRAQPPSQPQQDDGWYEYLFGKRPESDTTASQKSESEWYEYLFGKPQKNDPGQEDPKKEEAPKWWWPFE